MTHRGHRITSERFTSNLVAIARTYGFKTVGMMYDALERANANAKWCTGTMVLRSRKIKCELVRYMNA